MSKKRVPNPFTWLRRTPELSPLAELFVAWRIEDDKRRAPPSRRRRGLYFSTSVFTTTVSTPWEGGPPTPVRPAQTHTLDVLADGKMGPNNGCRYCRQKKEGPENSLGGSSLNPATLSIKASADERERMRERQCWERVARCQARRKPGR